MKVKSMAQLKNLVESGGMAVDDDGKVTKAETPQPAAAPDAQLLSAIRELIASNKTMAIAAMTPKPQVVQPQPTPQILKWKFTINRDADGFMSTVIAEAK